MQQATEDTAGISYLHDRAGTLANQSYNQKITNI